MRSASFVPAVILAATLVACDSPTAPLPVGPVAADPAASAVLPESAVVARAAGTAFRFPVAPDGSVVTVRMHFNVAKHGDGATRGFFTYDAGSTSLAVDVTCMTVVDGSRAWIAGVITESSIGFVGHVSYFYTFDNGEGAQDEPDTISLVRVETQPGLGEAQRFCDELPAVLPARVVERGNVNVDG